VLVGTKHLIKGTRRCGMIDRNGEDVKIGWKMIG